MTKQFKWQKLDKESEILFSIEEMEDGKYRFTPTYNNIKINIRDYDISISGIEAMFEVLNSLLMDRLKPKKTGKKNGKA